jgi:CheY-like chemotaxis protein
MYTAATVEWDLEAQDGLGAEQTSPAARLTAPGDGPRRERILIMDDDRMVRETMCLQLMMCGFDVTAAVQGEDAVSAYRQAREEGRPFAAVILDLMVATGWGGERTLAELLKLDPAVKALVCSGTLEGTKKHYEKQGFSGVLGKPYSLPNLRGEVEALLLAPAGPEG